MSGATLDLSSNSHGYFADTEIKPMNLGGGGNVGGFDISLAGVKFVRGDVFGGYILGADNTWHLINGISNMCPAGAPCQNFGLYPANTSGNQAWGGFSGVMELTGCPSSASCAYMYGGGHVYYSSNVSTTNPSSISWCDSGFTPVEDTSNNVISIGNPGPFMAVDPKNPAHVIVATPKSGVLESFNATTCGSAIWTTVSNIPVISSSVPAYLIAFDSTSSATCRVGGGTCAKNIYVGSSNGVYASNDSGNSWALTSGGPTALHHLRVSSAAAGGGNVWAADGNGKIWEYKGGVWTQLSNVSGGDVAINPLNGDHIAVGNGTTLYVSTNGSSASPTFASYTGSFGAGDSPWATAMQIIYYTGTNWIGFDSKVNDSLLMSGSQWVFKTTLPSSSPFSWSVFSSGIQGAVTMGNLQVSAAGMPTFGYEDIGACTMTISGAANPPSRCSPASSSYYLLYTSGLSVAPGTGYMASKTSNDFGPGFDLSGYSYDGYQNDFVPFNTWNTTISASNVAANPSGEYRVTLPSTSGFQNFSPGQTLTNRSIACFLWQGYFAWPGYLNETCWPVNVVDSTHIDLIGSTYASIASKAGTTYVVYNPAPPLSSWFGGGTVINVTNNGSGLVRVTYPNAANTGAHQTPVCISGVQMSSGTVVNGCWAVAASSGTSIDLLGSNFVGGDNYVSGGTVLSTGAPGGGVAASTPQNVTIYGADTTFPLCTTNGGASWSQVTLPGVPANTNGVTVTGGPYGPGTTSITVSNGGALGYQRILQLASGRYLIEDGGTTAGNTITLPNPIPNGDSLAGGSAVYDDTGGPFAVYFRTHQIAADQVTPNTFYYVNHLVGLAKWTNCGAATIVAPKSQGFLLSPYNDQLKAVPGQAGHLFFTTGSVGVPNHPYSNRLWRTCNATNNGPNSVTMQKVPGFFEAHAVGFGHAADGEKYPAIYVVGWYSVNDNMNDAVYGIWRSTDDPNSGVNGSCSGGNTWTNLAASTGGFPAGFPTGASDIEGDPFVFGPYYILGNMGQFYGVKH